MNAVHLHLIACHVPILFVPLALALLLWASWRGSADLRRAGLSMLVLATVVGWPVFLTGEPSEEVAEAFASERAIDPHEDAAKIAVWLLTASGGSALLALWRPGKITGVAPVLLAGFTTVALAYTGWLGGQIRHSELSSAPVARAARHDLGHDD